MSNFNRCIYCGAHIYRDRKMCPICDEKLRLIRKIRRIVFEIRRQAQREANTHEQKQII